MVVIFLPSGVADRSLAGANGFAVDVNRAGAAQAGAATEFRTGHLQLLADDPEQRRIVGRLDGHIPSVDIQIRHCALPLPVYEAAYGGNSLLGIGRHPPGRCQLARRMIPIRFRGNAIWNCSKRINFEACCALRQGFVATCPESASRRGRTFRFRISQRRTDRARIGESWNQAYLLGKSQCQQLNRDGSTSITRSTAPAHRCC